MVKISKKHFLPPKKPYNPAPYIKVSSFIRFYYLDLDFKIGENYKVFLFLQRYRAFLRPRTPHPPARRRGLSAYQLAWSQPAAFFPPAPGTLSPWVSISFYHMQRRNVRWGKGVANKFFIFPPHFFVRRTIEASHRQPKKKPGKILRVGPRRVIKEGSVWSKTLELTDGVT